MKKSLLLFILCAILSSLCAQTTWHVRPDAAGNASGLDWANAFPDLHDALAAAQAGDVVWVAQGEYRPDSGSNRNRRFTLKSGVKLYGGFSGMETTLAQRDWTAHPTLLSGNIGNPADSTDNAYTILYLPWPDSSTLVDGFNFRHGYAGSDTSFASSSPTLSGGAVFVQANNGIALPGFRHCIFRDNYAAAFGGAVFVSGQNTQGNTPLFFDCRFINNKAYRYGGAICIANGGNNYDRGVEFENCEFIKNTVLIGPTGQGGGIYIGKSFGVDDMSFFNCNIIGNSANTLGGFFSYWINNDINISISFESCIFEGNRSNFRSPVLSLQSAYASKLNFRLINSIVKLNKVENYDGILDDLFYMQTWETGMTDTILIRNNFFFQNQSSGVIYFESQGGSGIAIIDNNIFENNWFTESPTYTNLLNFYNINLTIKNNYFKNNFGAIRYSSHADSARLSISQNIFYNNNSLSYSPLIYCLIPGSAHSVFYNNAFIKNYSDYFSTNTQNTFFYLHNNNFFNNLNSSGQPTLPFRLGADTLYLSHNLMDVDCASLPPATTVCGPGNLLAADPMLVDTANGDFRLLPCSPAINAGNNAVVQALGLTTDFDGNPRIGDAAVDIGPYESPASALNGPPATTGDCHQQASGSVGFDLANACPPFAFAWSDGANSGTATDGLPAGDYAFTITDSRGKVLFSDVVIAASAPQTTIGGDTLACPGADNAVLVASTQNAEPPVLYQWNNGISNPATGPVGPGQYVVTATDALGCADTAVATVTEAPLLMALVTVQPASGPDQPDGSIQFQVTTGIGPFQYLWDNGDTTASPGGLLPGEYRLSVADAAGCLYVYGYSVGWVSDATPLPSENWRIYPNPAHEWLTIELPAGFRPQSWILTDAGGHTVQNVDVTRAPLPLRLSLDGLPAGNYLWRLLGEAGVKAGKVAKW